MAAYPNRVRERAWRNRSGFAGFEKTGSQRTRLLVARTRATASLHFEHARKVGGLNQSQNSSTCHYRARPVLFAFLGRTVALRILPWAPREKAHFLGWQTQRILSPQRLAMRWRWSHVGIALEITLRKSVTTSSTRIYVGVALGWHSQRCCQIVAKRGDWPACNLSDRS